jgi:hypothetical protein
MYTFLFIYLLIYLLPKYVGENVYGWFMILYKVCAFVAVCGWLYWIMSIYVNTYQHNLGYGLVGCDTIL